MRKEATLQEWEKLYDLAERYVKMKPWELLNNEEMVCVSFSEEDQAFFTVMGNGGMEYGFGMYVGEIAFRETQLQISACDGEDYGLYLQNCIVMFIDRKEDVPPEQMEVIRKLGRNYGRGRKWIYFENHARGYFPYIPDQRDVLNTIRFLEALMGALPRIEKIKPRGFHLMGHGFIHKLEKSEWKTEVVVWNQKELRKLPFAVCTEGLKSEAAKWKKRKEIWEVDIALMHSVINDEKYDRPLYPYLLLVMDHNKGIVIYQQLLEPADDPPALCRSLTNLMREHGMPEKILVSGNTMKEIFSVLKSEIGVPVEIDRLKHVKTFWEGFQRDFLDFNTGADGSMMKMLGLKEEEIASLMEMSGVDTEEELIQILGEKIIDAFGNGSDGAFFGNPPGDDILFENDGFDERAFEEFDEEDDYDLTCQEPKNMRERIRLINEFFEITFAYSEEDTEEDYEVDEDLAPGMIDAEWCDDWKRILGQCSIKKLKEMAKIIGVSAGNNKTQISSELSDVLLEKPARVKELLSEEERALMKRLRTMINKQECVMSDRVPFSRETVISLAEKGMADIRFGHDFMEIYLTIMIPKQMKGLRL